MSGVAEMSLVSWLSRHRDPDPLLPPSPIPEVAQAVQRQARELSKITEEVQRLQEARERKA